MSLLPAILNMFVVSLRSSEKLIRRDFNELEYLRDKPESADKFAKSAVSRLDNTILEDLQKLRPKYNYILSDGSKIEGSDSSNTVYINSIDGFENFKRANPFFTISIGLERDNEPFSGAVFQPMLGEMYLAEKNEGAFINNRRLKISSMPQPVVALADTTKIRPNQLLTRISGCFSLDMVFYASSRFGAVYYENVEYNKFVAPSIIVLEAGGNLQNLDTQKFTKKDKTLLACSNTRFTEWKKFLEI